MLTKKNLWFLSLSFIEGACLMVIELAGGKLMAPYYGQTLYVWTATLGTTLGGLALGYYIGGRLSMKWKAPHWVHLVVGICGIWLFFMPEIAHATMSASIEMEKVGNLGFKSGIIISTLSYLFFPVFLCGTISPLIIDQIKSSMKAMGQAAGIIYAISTLGGIGATYVVSFYLFPFEGISFSCMLFGGMLITWGILGSLMRKQLY